MMERKFIVYEEETEVFRGTAQEIAETLGFREQDIRYYADQGFRFEGKYLIREITYTAYEQTMDYLIRHLKKHKNTVLGEEYSEKEVRRFLKDLETEGLRARYRKVKLEHDRKSWYVIETDRSVQE